jgi:hypothetical protein
MDRQAYIDRLLEAENLTDQLDDNAAKVLMDWAVSQVDELTSGLKNKPLADEKVTALLAFLRAVNAYVGGLPDSTSEGLKAVLDHYSAVFGRLRPVGEGDRSALTRALGVMPDNQAVSYLLNWLKS